MCAAVRSTQRLACLLRAEKTNLHDKVAHGHNRSETSRQLEGPNHGRYQVPRSPFRFHAPPAKILPLHVGLLKRHNGSLEVGQIVPDTPQLPASPLPQRIGRCDIAPRPTNGAGAHNVLQAQISKDLQNTQPTWRRSDAEGGSHFPACLLLR